jgi:hypothetical protein
VVNVITNSHISSFEDTHLGALYIGSHSRRVFLSCSKYFGVDSRSNSTTSSKILEEKNVEIIDILKYLLGLGGKLEIFQFQKY